MKILCQCSFLIFAVTQVVAQANIVQPTKPVQPPASTTTTAPTSGSDSGTAGLPVCDRNGILLDVLKTIASAQLVKEETDYETKKKLDEAAIYKRRMGVIKALASKQ